MLIFPLSKTGAVLVSTFKRTLDMNQVEVCIFFVKTTFLNIIAKNSILSLLTLVSFNNRKNDN